MHKYSLKTITFISKDMLNCPHFQMHFYYIMLIFWPKGFKVKHIFCHHQQYVKNPSYVLTTLSYVTLTSWQFLCITWSGNVCFYIKLDCRIVGTQNAVSYLYKGSILQFNMASYCGLEHWRVKEKRCYKARLQTVQWNNKCGILASTLPTHAYVVPECI